MSNASKLAEFNDNYLIHKYGYGHLSRQKRLQIIDSIQANLPHKIRETENLNLQYFLNLSSEKIDMNNGFKDVNLNSIKTLVKNELTFEKLIKGEKKLDFNQKKLLATKSYLIPTTNLDDYGIDHPVIKLATNPVILASIANYMAEAPILWNAQILYSPSKSINLKNNFLNNIRNLRYRGGFAKYEGSQLFHIDVDHPHTVKLWVYLTDVEKNSGPLTILPGGVSDKATLELGDKSSKKQLDKTMKKYINKKMKLLRKSESVFLVDTGRCFHYGSRDISSKKERFALVIHYTSLFSEYLFNKTNSEKAKLRIEKFLSNGSSPLLEKLTRYKEYFY